PPPPRVRSRRRPGCIARTRAAPALLRGVAPRRRTGSAAHGRRERGLRPAHASARGGACLRAVKVIGGGFLVFLAVDAIREGRRPKVVDDPGGGLHPSVRGIVAVLLNPGVYVFLATTGTAVVASAVDEGGG